MSTATKAMGIRKPLILASGGAKGYNESVTQINSADVKRTIEYKGKSK